jgi:hypothetical protein
MPSSTKIRTSGSWLAGCPSPHHVIYLSGRDTNYCLLHHPGLKPECGSTSGNCLQTEREKKASKHHRVISKRRLYESDR